jgi:hypothetical protein
MSELTQLLGMVTDLKSLVTAVDRKVEALSSKPKPHLSQVEFAKAVGKHPKTVSRWIALGRVRTEKRGIPHTELAKFVS